AGSLLSNVLGDFCHGAEPDPVRRIFQVFAKGFERRRVRHLVASFADLVADENNPAALIRGLFHLIPHLFGLHVIEGSAHSLPQLANMWVIGRFAKATASNKQPLRNQRYIAPSVESSTPKFLSTRMG